MTDYRLRTDCRLCGDPIRTVLEFPDTPLANEYPLAPIEGGQDVFPLAVAQCQDIGCGHFQLTADVNPARMFTDYQYVSGTSPVFREHLGKLADRYAPSVGDGYVLEIASNDGTLLQQFKDRGVRVLGVDPAKNLAEKASADGIPTIPEFWTLSLSEKIRKQHGRSPLIVALNVFAHVPDLINFTAGIANCLDPKGTLVIEVGYWPTVVKRGQFDVIYHEHTSYHHLIPLIPFFQRFGMSLVDAELVDSQGGSVRLTIVKNKRHVPMTQRLLELIIEEELFVRAEQLAATMETTRTSISEAVGRLTKTGAKVAGFGCPAKLTTLMYHVGLTGRDVSRIYDDNPLKVGRYTPGRFVPIVASSTLMDDPPDYLILFSWNFAQEIMGRLRSQGYEGRFIVPLPEVRIV